MNLEELKNLIKVPGRYLVYAMPCGKFSILPLGDSEIVINPSSLRECLEKFSTSEKSDDL